MNNSFIISISFIPIPLKLCIFNLHKYQFTAVYDTEIISHNRPIYNDTSYPFDLSLLCHLYYLFHTLLNCFGFLYFLFQFTHFPHKGCLTVLWGRQSQFSMLSVLAWCHSLNALSDTVLPAHIVQARCGNVSHIHHL